MDQGPRVVGCDYQMKGFEQQTDFCLILGEGQFSGGAYGIALRIGTDPHTYVIEDTEARIYATKDITKDPQWTGAVEITKEQCRPAGVDAEQLTFDTGMTICLYRN